MEIPLCNADHPSPGLWITYPSAAQGVHVGATDSTVGNSHVDISLLPRLRLELLPNHVALGGSLVQAHPAFELIIGGSHFADSVEACFKLVVCWISVFSQGPQRGLYMKSFMPRL